MDLVQKGSLVVSATPELRATVANLKVKVEMQAAPALPPSTGKPVQCSTVKRTIILSCAESEGND